MRVSNRQPRHLRLRLTRHKLPVPVGHNAAHCMGNQPMARALRIVRADDDATPIRERERAIQQIDERINFRPTWDTPAPVMKGRGIYVANVRDLYGNPIVYAVRADSRVVHRRPWLRHEAYDAVAAEMWHVLDRMDPPVSRSRDDVSEPSEDLVQSSP